MNQDIKRENTKFLDAVLGRPAKPKTRRNLIIDNAWEDLKAGRISVFEYNHKHQEALKFDKNV